MHFRPMIFFPKYMHYFGWTFDIHEPFFYAPCDFQQQSLFIQNLCTDIVSKTNTSRITIAGDWNTTLRSIDKCGGRP